MSETASTDTTTTTDAPASGSSTPPQPRTFTQEQLDKIISTRVAEIRSRYSDYEQLQEKAAKFDEAERAQLSERERIERERDEAKAAADAAKAEAQAATLSAAKLQAALAAGLPVEAAARLQGANADELKADAEALAGLIGSSQKEPEPNPEEGFDGGTRREQPKGMTREAIQKLARENPTKLNAMLEAGELSLADL